MEKLTDLTNKSAEFKYHYGLGWIDCNYTWKMKIREKIKELGNGTYDARIILEKLLEDTNE